MVGSTSRCALTVQNPAYGLCSQGVNGVNSDVIMILHADPAHHRLALLSIPRDLFIPNARSTGANKIDAGLYQGISQLVAAIEEDFGIPIQHAVSLNFDQFANVVDALGGINMSFPMSVFDARVGPERPGRHLRPPQRHPGPRGGPGPSPPVQVAATTSTVRRGLAPGEPERPGPDPTGPRVPPGAGRRGGQTGPGQPDHRPQPDQLGEGRPHLRPVAGRSATWPTWSSISTRSTSTRCPSSPCRSPWSPTPTEPAEASSTRAAATGTSSSRPSPRTRAPSTRCSASGRTSTR